VRQCRSAQKLDQPHRDIADAVFSELQVDMESFVEKAVNQMSSWISAEVAFVRQGIEKDVLTKIGATEEARGRTEEARSRKDEEFKHSQMQMAAKVDLMQSDLRETVLAVGKLQANARRGLFEGDKQLQAKLKDIQATLAVHSESFETLGNHAAYCDKMISDSRLELDRHTSELARLAENTGEACSDLHTGEARSDLMAWELKRLHASISEELATKASHTELTTTFTTWTAAVEDAWRKQDASIGDLSKRLEENRSTNVAHGVLLNKHEDSMVAHSTVLNSHEQALNRHEKLLKDMSTFL